MIKENPIDYIIKWEPYIPDWQSKNVEMHLVEERSFSWEKAFYNFSNVEKNIINLFSELLTKIHEKKILGIEPNRSIVVLDLELGRGQLAKGLLTILKELWKQPITYRAFSPHGDVVEHLKSDLKNISGINYKVYQGSWLNPKDLKKFAHKADLIIGSFAASDGKIPIGVLKPVVDKLADNGLAIFCRQKGDLSEKIIEIRNAVEANFLAGDFSQSDSKWPFSTKPPKLSREPESSFSDRQPAGAAVFEGKWHKQNSLLDLVASFYLANLSPLEFHFPCSISLPSSCSEDYLVKTFIEKHHLLVESQEVKDIQAKINLLEYIVQRPLQILLKEKSIKDIFDSRLDDYLKIIRNEYLLQKKIDMKYVCHIAHKHPMDEEKLHELRMIVVNRREKFH